MGIGRGCARLLLAEAAARPFSGKVLQLGRQHLFFGEAELQRWAELHEVRLRRDFPARNRLEPLLDPACLDDGSFFSLLGFDTVESVDVSNDESPTFVFDLNGDVPESLHGRYDCVYDGGTLEHLFDVPKALRNIHVLLKTGGRIIHASPSSNHVDHGFYMFSPTLFYDYYAVNDYEILESQLIFYTRNHEVEPWQIFDYSPGCLDHLSFGGFDNGFLIGISLAARKTEKSVCDQIPQQGYYLKKWKDEAFQNLQEDYRKAIEARPPAPGAASPGVSFWRRLRDKATGRRREPDGLRDRKVAEY